MVLSVKALPGRRSSGRMADLMDRYFGYWFFYGGPGPA
jgi:hypothetical protein